MKTAIIFGVTFAAGAMFFACAKGDDAVEADGGAGTAPDDASAGDGSPDGNSSYGGKDGAASGDGAATDSGEDGGISPPVCVESDAGCTTGSPGACADGIIHCDGGVAVCEPTVTTESCYSASVSTVNKGICHDGTQTCTGTFGPCVGEVDPASAEDCFDNLDNDCDGFINNGCPTSVSLGASRTLAGNGGPGGGLHTLLCPTGAFVTRVDSWFDNDDSKASGVSIYCATPTLVQGATTYSVTLAANSPAPYGTEHGSTDPGNQRTDDCGISGLTAITYSLGYADTFVEALGHHCSSSAVTLAANNTITFGFNHDGYGNPPGEYNSYGTPPGTFFISDCNTGETPNNQVAIGFSIHDGAYLDNITPICAPLVVNYSAGTPDP